MSNLKEIIRRTGQLPSRSAQEKNPDVKRAAKFVDGQQTLPRQCKLSDRQKEELSKLAHWTWDALSTHRSTVVKRPAAGTGIMRPAAAEGAGR